MRLTIVTLLLSFVIGACVACGTDDIFQSTPVYNPPINNKHEVEIDEELKLFVDLFMEDCNTRRTDCKHRLQKIKEIKVVDMPDVDKLDNQVVIGVCYDNIIYKKVHINKEMIGYADKYLQALMYHELGHCMYDLDHVEESDKLMSPAMPSFIILLQNWKELVTEMFTAIEERNGP
jgi:hypothetical protein